MKSRLLLPLLFFITLLSPASAWVRSSPEATWPVGAVVTMQLRLGTSPPLIDGRTWDANAIEAMQIWNGCMHDIQLAWQTTGTTTAPEHNQRNDLFFASDLYGEAWDANVLAVTITWKSGSTRTESDILFNKAKQWDAYRGSLRYPNGYGYPTSEFRRVAMHELGHVLGLGHPDQNGQWLSALMNSAISDWDNLAEDDKEGIGSLYGYGPDNQPKPPTILAQPSALEVYVGDSALFIVSAAGTGPLRYQWRKDGVALAGSTDSSFQLPAVATQDVGDYSVEVTNAVGTAISNPARLTVRAIALPVFTSPPSSVTVTEGNYTALFGYADGRNVTLQWNKDGMAIPGAIWRWFRLQSARIADAGIYTLVASNVAGSVTSEPATLIVTPAVAPRITQEPLSAIAAIGSRAGFDVTVEGSNPLSFQWYHDGKVIDRATDSRIRISSVSATDQGDYMVKIVNAGGEVSSAAAHLEVKMEPLFRPPPISSGQLMESVYEGNALMLGPSSNPASGTATFQWFRNGIAIPGETGYFYYNSNATAAHVGEYLLEVTNTTGTTTSLPSLVSVTQQPAAWSWLDIQSYNGIVYVLYATPSRIERYDLLAGRWLPSVPLPKAATAFRVNADGVYVAFGKSISRFDAAISGDVSITTTLTAQDITALAIWSNYVYAFSGNWNVYDKGTGGLVYTTSSIYGIFPLIVLAPITGQIYVATGWSNSGNVGSFALDSAGTIAELFPAPSDRAFPMAKRVFLSPGEDLLAGDGGTLYRTKDFSLVGGLGGPMQDVAFPAAGGAVVLRGSQLHRLDASWHETGVTALASSGDRLFSIGDDVFVFSQTLTAGGPIGVTRVALSSLLPRPTATPVSADALAFTPDDVTVDRDGTVLLTSRRHRNVFRWSSREHRYLAPATLTGAPTFVAYSGSANALILAYPDGRIMQKALPNGDETWRGATPRTTSGLAAAGDIVLASDACGAWASHYTFAADGSVLSWVEWNHYSRVYTWSAVNRRLFQFRDDSTPNNLRFEEINANGTIGTQGNSPDRNEVDCIPPIRVSPDGQLVLLGSGAIYNGTTLERVGALANTIDDGDWVGGQLTTFRIGLMTCELQQWSYPGFTQTRSVKIEGYPLRLVTLPSGQLLAVTLVKQRPQFSLFDGDLNLVYRSPTSALASIAAHPVSTVGQPGSTLNLAVSAAGEGPLTYQWFRNGTQIAGATNATLILNGLAPLQAGLYDCSVAASGSSALSHPAVVGLTLPAGERTAGGVTTRPEWEDIRHPVTGAIYDQFLLSGAAGTFTADPGQIARCSYLDSNGSIVQVEMSGAGAITIVLDNPTGPTAPVLYNQSGIDYMKGKATIILAGADSTTHFTIYSVGTATNPGVTRPDVTYVGWADVAVAGIVSSDGGLGGIHQGNASYNAKLGYTGLYAPTVNSVGGSVVVHAIAASDHALPFLYFAPGSQVEVKIAGSSLTQSAGDSISVSGLSQVQMGAGQDSCGRPAPAQAIQTRLLDAAGVDVTAALVVGP